MKSFCAKDIVKVEKRQSQSTEWKMTMAIYMSVIGISFHRNIFYKSLRKRGNPIEKWVMELNKFFTREDIHMAYQFMIQYFL